VKRAQDVELATAPTLALTREAIDHSTLEFSPALRYEIESRLRHCGDHVKRCTQLQFFCIRCLGELKAMRRRIALQKHCMRNPLEGVPVLRKLLECAHVLASLSCQSREPTGRAQGCAEDRTLL